MRLCVQLFSIFFLGLVALSDVQAEQSKIKVGVIIPLTGEAASVGNAFKNGMQLGMEKLSDAAKAKLEFIYEDDALQASRSVSAFKKLSAVNDIDVVVTLSSGTSLAIAPLAEKAKLPLVAVASDPAVVKDRKYAVNFWVTPEAEARAMLPTAVSRGYRKVARVSTVHNGAFAVRQAFDDVNAGQIEVVLDEEFAPDSRDFRTVIAKIRSRKDVDAVMLVLLPGQLGLFAKQLRASGVDLPLFGFEALEDSQEVKASNNALVGAWYVNADDPNGVFISAYQKRFPEASLWSASNGHDTVLLLGAAVERSASREGINKFLHTVENFSGALGTYSASGDNRFTLPAAVKVVTPSGFEKIKS